MATVATVAAAAAMADGASAMGLWAAYPQCVF